VKSKIMAAMSKMNGTELGKLWLKDAAALLTKGVGAYTVDDFCSILSKADRSNRIAFVKYKSATTQLFLMSYLNWWGAAMIRENVFRIEALLGTVRLSIVVHVASDIAKVERIYRDQKSGDSDEPWESEIVFTEKYNEFREAVLGSKPEVEKIYDGLNTLIRTHKTYVAAMAIMAETMQMPEIATIPHEVMTYVEQLNESLRKLEDPYREVFPEIDIDALDPSQEEIDDLVKRVSI